LLTTAQKADPAAFEQIGNGSGSLVGIAAATGYGKDQITERKLGPVGFAQMFFHIGLRLVDELGFSNSRAITIKNVWQQRIRRSNFQKVHRKRGLDNNK